MNVQLWQRMAMRVALVAALGAPSLVGSVAHAQPVLPPIAPAKPAAPRAANALVISTGDLNEAVNWARQGNLQEASTSFKLFKDDWAAIRDDVSAQSQDIATGVDNAIADIGDAIDDNPPPDQSTYYPMFQTLAQVVEDSNTQLGSIAPATAALRINATNLGQAVTWASQGNLARAHDEFGQFQDDWALVKDTVRQQSPLLAAGIDAGIAQVLTIINDPRNANPAQSDYFPAMQALQQVVIAGNTQLATLAPLAAGLTPPAASSGPVKIRPGNLGESVDWASQGNLNSARSEFGQFQDDWSSVQAVVRQQQPAVADQVDSALANVKTILSGSNPAQTDYLPALQSLQAVVDAANKQLGN